ncbi:MAG: DUF5132 domain-containing protein [Pseudonocardiaceae bacterium]
MAPPVLTPYLIGLVTAPLVAKVVKPLLRGTVKTTVGLALQAKKLAAEAVEDVQDLAAEASAEMVSAEMASAQRAADVAAKTGPSPASAAAAVAEAAHSSRGSAGSTRRGGTA